MIARYAYLIVAIVSLHFSFGQTVVTEEEFIAAVIQYHPIALQADLREAIGNAKLLKAKGWFDPKLTTDFNQKSFDDKNYFQMLDGSLKVPTWIGADLKLGYSWNNGVFLNPENNLPSNGLLSAGIELPVLRGLIMDKRRADLQQGKNYAQMGQLERQQLLNELVFEASQAYWQWFEANRNFTISAEGVILAEATLEFTRVSSRLGDKPYIDTLEALIQVQNRQVDKALDSLELINSRLWASSFLWLDDLTPALIAEDAVPMSFERNDKAIQEFLDEMAAKLIGREISFAFKGMNAEFIKRAESDIIFESNQGDLVKAAIDKSISEKSRVNETIEVVAKNDACEVVAKFDMIVSVRVS